MGFMWVVVVNGPEKYNPPAKVRNKEEEEMKKSDQPGPGLCFRYREILCVLREVNQESH